MKNISKSFGAVEALKDVHLSLGEGEIHGLLGENGAGKSTLMNILGGVIPPDKGDIIIDSNSYPNLTTKTSFELGIGFIHQELNLVTDLKIYENLFLGREIVNSCGFLDKKAMKVKAREVFKKMNLDIDENLLVSDIDTCQKQLVEIGKALLFQCKTIIMDEPTTALTNKEIDNLFKIMEGLKAHGVSIIYISHKMPELFRICDRYTVLRDGRFIDSGEFTDLDEKKATELLVGKKLEGETINRQKNDNPLYMEIKDLSYMNYFNDINFNVRKGEIVAVTGLFGDGRGELVECLFGVKSATSGSISIDGREVDISSVKKAINNGISMIPRNRKEKSIIKDMSILDNLSMASYENNYTSHFISNRVEDERFRVNKRKINIKSDTPSNLITSLSGGNQQKVIFSRWLELNSDIYIFDNPTQGIDVGAKFEIYKIIDSLSKDGKTILLFSSEFPEIMQLADRCIVMYKGRINKCLERSEINEVNIMYLATGSNLEEGK